MSSSLPEGFTVRPVRSPEDAEAVSALATAADVAVQGWSDATPSDLLFWWREIDLEHDSWVIEDGSIAAYGLLDVQGETAELDNYVHPDKKGAGLGTWLLRRGEERARQRGLKKAHSWALAPDDDARRLFERAGFREARRYYRMLIDLDGAPPEPEWPKGFRVETFRLDDARAFHDALTESFADEWNWSPMPFERWLELRVNAPDADHSLWFMVRDGEQIAAVLRGDPNRFDCGWIGAVGVRRPWRRRGLGLALLLHAFGEFYRRGERRVALGVDAQNPTGATRLYERAGMRVGYEALAYEKALDGR